MVMSREMQVSRLFVELADTLVDDYDVVEVLHRLADASVELLAVQAAGVMLAEPDGLRLVASSSSMMEDLERGELELGEGPCLDAYRTGHTLTNIGPDETRHRWPRFAAHVHPLGIHVVHALPMRLRGQRIGAINLFATTEEPLPEADVRLGQAFADVATIGLLQQRAIRDHVQLSGQLQEAFTTRVLLEQAKGMLAERTGCTPTEAFQRLRSHARRTQSPLHQVAQQVLAGDLDPLAAG